MFLFKGIPQWMNNNSDFEPKECESAVVNKVMLTRLHGISINCHTQHKALERMRNRRVEESFPKGGTQFHHSVFPAFLLHIKFTINPSMQLNRIREKPGVSIFQLHTDNRAGGLQACWWHHPRSNYGAHVLADRGSGQSHLCLALTVLCRRLTAQRQPS